MSKITINATEQDIHAKGAFNGTSFSPEKREASAVQGYISHMAAIAAEFEKWATDDNAAQMNADLERYRAKWVENENAYLSAHSRVMSTMIAGPSNFPTRSMQKKNASVDKRMKEAIEWQEKAIDRLRSTYNPSLIARAPIMADDPDALDKLQEKVAALKAHQELMKAHNKLVRSKADKTAKTAALVALHGTEEELAEAFRDLAIMKNDVYTFQMTNNLANIKRLEGRIRQLGKLKNIVADNGATTLPEQTIAHGVTVERDLVDVRLRVRFPDKPTAEVRTIMKRHGFVWSPKSGAWQRQLTGNAEWSLKQIIPLLKQHYTEE